MDETLESFRRKVGGAEPVPAGVAIAAVNASLALALLAKVLDITGRRKDFAGDRQRIGELANAAWAESTRLTQVADDDVRAFEQYLDCKRGDSGDMASAVRRTIEVPLNGARATVRGLDLCVEGAGLVSGLTAADLGIAAALLAGSLKAMLISIDSNLQEMRSEAEFSAVTTAECRELEVQARRCSDTVGTGPAGHGTG